MLSNDQLKNLITNGNIDQDGVRLLRQALFGKDIRVSREDAEMMISLNDQIGSPNPAWSDLFVEVMVDYLVRQEEPQGYVSKANADWLIRAFSKSGAVNSSAELEAIIQIMDAAQKVPESLEKFAMNVIKQAVLTGAGPTRSGADLVPGRIGRAEVDYLRRIIYACGGNDGVAISRAEAEALFDINDAVSDVTNDASWPDLFVKAIANYLMAHRGYTPPRREEALRRAEWLDNDEDAGVGRFFGKILAGGLRGVLASYNEDSGEKHQTRLAEISKAEVVNQDECDWLIERIGRDGEFEETEKALLLFIKTESPDIHPSLKPLLDQVA